MSNLAAANASPLHKIDTDTKRLINSLNKLEGRQVTSLHLTNEIKDYIAQYNYIACKLRELLKTHSEVLKSQVRKTATTADKEAELLDKYPDL